MRPFFTLFILIFTPVLILSGCGYDPKDPVYDTKANPDDYPPAAIALLDDLESGTLVSNDMISARFAELYTTESGLLDNEKWKRVIERLGARLAYKADSLVSTGLSSYSTAAGYYSLASFARPHDRETAHKARQFASWSTAVRQYDDTAESIIRNPVTLPEKIELLRKFWGGDEISREFASTYLLEPLFEQTRESAAITRTQAQSLNAVDLALARTLGLTGNNGHLALATFVFSESHSDTIHLLAARARHETGAQYFVEAYFTVDESLTSDLTVSVRVGTKRSGRRLIEENLAFVPYEAKPLVPARQWRPDEVYAVFLRFDAPVEPSGVTLGLVKNETSSPGFARVVGEDHSFVQIPVEPD